MFRPDNHENINTSTEEEKDAKEPSVESVVLEKLPRETFSVWGKRSDG